MYVRECNHCHQTFPKRPTQSLATWNSGRTKYCSKTCTYAARVGSKHSEEHKAKIRASMKLVDQSWKIGRPHGHKTNHGHTWKLTDAQRKAISDRLRGKPRFHMRGEKNNNWKGGITSANMAIRNSAAYKAWRRSVFERDHYTCVECGQVGGKLQVDHIKPFSLYPELRLDISNGRVLCKPCHMATDSFAGKALRLAKELKSV